MIWGAVIAGTIILSGSVLQSRAETHNRTVEITWPDGTVFNIIESKEEGMFTFHTRKVSTIEELIAEHSVNTSCNIQIQNINDGIQQPLSHGGTPYCVELGKWTKYGKDLDIRTGSPYEIDHQTGTGENKLTIKYATRENSTGEYAAVYRIGVESSSGSCKCNLKTNCVVHHCKVSVNADPFVKDFPTKSVSVTEEDDLKLECGALGYPKPEVTWFINTDTDDTDNAMKYKLLDPQSDDRISLTDVDGYVNASLSIKRVASGDEGIYKCVVSRREGGEEGNITAEKTVRVRVKGKLAFLWPTIGIACEVVCIAAFTLYCDKRQRSKEAAKQRQYSRL